MTLIIDGKKLSDDIKQELKENTLKLKNETGVIPGLAVLQVGEDPASSVYVNSKQNACKELGYYSIVKRVGTETSESDVLEIVNQWNNAPDIHGILVQLPLPKHIDEQKVITTISPDKDVDGFHPFNVGKLVIGLAGHISCTPYGIIEMLKRYNIDTKGKHTVVVGRSNIVGKPIANLMYQKKEYANSIVTICHSATKNISYYTKQADILIVAVGVANLITKEDVKEGAVIIDVGINRIETNDEKGYKIVGDVDYDSVFDKVSAITPVPGGVGRMTIAMLMQNTYNSAYEASKRI
jgi:methylenetetrahydrofolate dehydrogenase (NADP+)/methenyltetrahydrofolate cyclohydrolase